MNIEFRFLQKAIADKNYISFNYGNQNFKNLKPLKLDEQNRVHCDKGVFEFANIKKLAVLKEKF